MGPERSLQTDTAAPSAVSVRGVYMAFDNVPAVQDASFDLAPGRFLTILGPSGSGKSTLLRMIAGFFPPTRGEILVGGVPVRRLAARDRAIGMVFQRLALFPHMTAAENVAFPLKMRRFDARTIPDRVAEYLRLVRLDGLGARRIGELSGGQQQRVAIARALVFEPDLLLLDEPLAALDRRLREEMQLEFRRIQRELGVTTINVTHDQREALVMSDDVIVMESGRIRQNADPAQLYRAPADAFVADFVGVTSLIEGALGHVGGGSAMVAYGDAACRGVPVDHGLSEGTPVVGAIRAEAIRIASEADALAGLDTLLAGTVRDAIFEGDRLLYEVEVPALGEVLLRVHHHDPLSRVVRKPGDAVHLGWNAPDMHIFAAHR